MAGLPPLQPLVKTPSYHPRFISAGGDPGNDPGSGDQGGTGPVIWGPPSGPRTNCDLLTDPTCGQDPGGSGGGSGGGGTSGGGGGTTTTSGSGSCSLSGLLLTPTAYAAACLLRLVLLILGIIAVIGGIYLLKPTIVTKPLKAGAKAAGAAAIAA